MLASPVLAVGMAASSQRQTSGGRHPRIGQDVAVDRPSRSYLLCGNARCGSTLLCRALSDTGVAGRPAEYFLTWPDPLPDHNPPLTQFWEHSELARSNGVSTREDYLRLVYRLGTTPNGVFGAKLMWNYTPYALASFQQMPQFAGLDAAAVLTAAFPDLRVVHLVRRDRLRQAVSWLRAAQDGVWLTSDTEPARPSGTPAYDRDVIAGMMDLITTGEQAWLDLYAQLGLQPLEVAYEDLLTPEGYDAAVRSILRHLDLPDDVAIPAPRTRRQADRINDEWVQRFGEEVQARG